MAPLGPLKGSPLHEYNMYENVMMMMSLFMGVSMYDDDVQEFQGEILRGGGLKYALR